MITKADKILIVFLFVAILVMFFISFANCQQLVFPTDMDGNIEVTIGIPNDLELNEMETDRQPEPGDRLYIYDDENNKTGDYYWFNGDKYIKNNNILDAEQDTLKTY